jgi:dTDP-4-amino-4,6-dideoxygalactose transaminase
MGKYVSLFEDEFAKYHNIKECIAVATGTDADAIALAVCHNLVKKQKKEVIIPSLTFISTANAVIEANGKPVFVDILPTTYQIDHEKIEEKITPNTTAIMPVHLFGYPADMDPINEIAQKYNLLVIEDAAEAHGAEYKGRKVGTIGNMGAFSFYVAHIITTGEGGAIITDNEKYASLARSLRAHGRACNCKRCVLNISSTYCPLRFKYKEDPRFFFEYIGYSSKMNEIEAALGIEQVKNLDKIIAQRRKNFFYLSKYLSEFEEFLQLLRESEEVKISPLVYPIVIRPSAPFTREEITRYLEEKGIETRPMFGCIPTQQPAYKFIGHKLGDFPNAEYVGENGFYVGVHQDLTQDELDYLIQQIHDFMKKQ